MAAQVEELINRQVVRTSSFRFDLKDIEVGHRCHCFSSNHCLSQYWYFLLQYTSIYLILISVSRKYEKVFIFHIGEKKTRNSYVICPLNFSYFIFTKWQNASFVFIFHIHEIAKRLSYFIFLIYFLKFFFTYFIFLIFAFLHISYLHFSSWSTVCRSYNRNRP